MALPNVVHTRKCQKSAKLICWPANRPDKASTLPTMQWCRCPSPIAERQTRPNKGWPINLRHRGRQLISQPGEHHCHEKDAKADIKSCRKA